MDSSNCGGCGVRCQAPTTCNSGLCDCAVPGQIPCGAACIDPQTDSTNCGGCGTKCTLPEVCVKGTCGCPVPGQIFCNGQCINGLGDQNNCGACNNVCSGATPACIQGVCSPPCPPGQSLCSGSCINTATDPLNCGGCGLSCAADTCGCANSMCAGGTIYFGEDFADNSKGWTLDTEWQIAAAKASNCSLFSNDPATDHTPTADNGVAGVVIGGCENPVVHPPYYLTSPAINLAGAVGTVDLSFYRWLNSDYQPYMTNTVEVFNGSTWTVIFSTGGPPSVADSSWTKQVFDVTPYKNASFRVRFGYSIGSGGVFTVSQWNVDDVTLSSSPCN
jgi:hypothetical protein